MQKTSTFRSKPFFRNNNVGLEINNLPPIPSNLVAYYRLNGDYLDAAGGSAITPFNSPVFLKRKNWGSSVLLSGPDKYIALPNNTITKINNTVGFTFALWARTDNVSTLHWQRLIDFNTSTTNYLFLAPNSGATGRPRIGLRVGGGSEQVVDSSVSISAGVWVHYAFTKVGNSANFYVNGELAGTNASMTQIVSNLGASINCWIGRSAFAGDPYFIGALDDIRIFNQALTLQQVQALIARPL